MGRTEGGHRRGTLASTRRSLVRGGVGSLLGLSRCSLPALRVDCGTERRSMTSVFIQIGSNKRDLARGGFVRALVSICRGRADSRVGLFYRRSHVPTDKASCGGVVTVRPSRLVQVTININFHETELHCTCVLLQKGGLRAKGCSTRRQRRGLTGFGRTLLGIVSLGG